MAFVSSAVFVVTRNMVGSKPERCSEGRCSESAEVRKLSFTGLDLGKVRNQACEGWSLLRRQCCDSGRF